MGTHVLHGPDLGWSGFRGRLYLRGVGGIVDLGPAHRVPRGRPRGLGPRPAAADPVVVRPGNSVWSIAASHYPGDDVRARVAEILAVNHLSSATIQPGETLVLPAS